MGASMDPVVGEPRWGVMTGRLRVMASTGLAIPLLGSAANYLLEFIEPPAGDDYPGAQMWRIMRDGGLFLWVVMGHAATGLMLLLPRWRFLGALLQLPITLGIAAFNLTLFPPGLIPALAMCALNLVAIADPAALRALMRGPRS